MRPIVTAEYSFNLTLAHIILILNLQNLILKLIFIVNDLLFYFAFLVDYTLQLHSHLYLFLTNLLQLLFRRFNLHPCIHWWVIIITARGCRILRENEV